MLCVLLTLTIAGKKGSEVTRPVYGGEHCNNRTKDNPSRITDMLSDWQT